MSGGLDRGTRLTALANRPDIGRSHGRVLLSSEETTCDDRGRIEDDMRMRDGVRGGGPSFQEQLGYLRHTLGPNVTAHLAGLRHADQLVPAALEQDMNSSVGERLREAYGIVRLLVVAYDAATARSWLFGSNSFLDDQAPIDLLRTAVDADDFAALRAAAQGFARPA